MAKDRNNVPVLEPARPTAPAQPAPYDPYAEMARTAAPTPTTPADVAALMTARAEAAKQGLLPKRPEPDPEPQAPLPTLPLPQPAPYKARVYKADASPLLIQSLELLERIHLGNQLLPQAYAVLSAVIDQIGRIKAEVIE